MSFTAYHIETLLTRTCNASSSAESKLEWIRDWAGPWPSHSRLDDVTYENTTPDRRDTMGHPHKCSALGDNANKNTDHGKKQMYWWDSVGQCNENVHGTGNMSIISLDWTWIDSRRNSRRNTATIREKNVKHTLHLKRSEREKKRLETFACLFFLFFLLLPLLRLLSRRRNFLPVRTTKENRRSFSPVFFVEHRTRVFRRAYQRGRTRRER